MNAGFKGYAGDLDMNGGGKLHICEPGCSDVSGTDYFHPIDIGVWVTVEISAKGNLITLSINGQIVSSMRDDHWQTGSAGISVDGGTSVQFDDLRVIALGDSLPTPTVSRYSKVFTKENQTENLSVTAPVGTLIIAGGNKVDNTPNAILVYPGNQTLSLLITNGYMWVYPVEEAEKAFCDELENTLNHHWQLDNLRPYVGWTCGGRLNDWVKNTGIQVTTQK